MGVANWRQVGTDHRVRLLMITVLCGQPMEVEVEVEICSFDNELTWDIQYLKNTKLV